MRLIAVCNIIDKDNNTIGLRLLDVDTKTIKDVPVDDVVDVLNKGIATIENIGTNGNELIGTNGSINRLTKVKGGKVYGKSSLVIIDEIIDKGYLVADYKGTMKKYSTENVIKYAKNNGIANGKVVNKDEKEFISSISGAYNKVEMQVSSTRGKELYTGEKVEDIEELKPLYLFGTVLYYKNNDFFTSKDYYELKDTEKINNQIIKNNGVYELYNMYTLLKSIDRDIDNTNIEQKLPYIDHLLFSKRSYESVKAFTLERYNNNANIVMSFTSIENIGKIEITDKEQQKFIVNQVKKLCNDISERIIIPDVKFALVRSNNGKGVNYKIHLGRYTDHKSNIKTERLENIYRDKDEYANVWEDENYFYIRGLDGVYKYDMSTIAEQYKRMEAPSKKNLKAKILNSDYKESVTLSGELLSITSKEEILKIPTSVVKIMQKSITINEENKTIIFPNTIKSSNIKIIESFHYTGIEKVIIECCTEASINILKGILDEPIFNYDSVIEFNRDITPIEYALIVSSRYFNKINIKANNINMLDSNFLKETLNEHIKIVKAHDILANKVKIKPLYTKSGRLKNVKSDNDYTMLYEHTKKFYHYVDMANANNLDINDINYLKGTVDKIRDIYNNRMAEYNKELEAFKRDYETYYK